jgi:hypothetical protein
MKTADAPASGVKTADAASAPEAQAEAEAQAPLEALQEEITSSIKRVEHGVAALSIRSAIGGPQATNP